jgi:hypothetical protein
MMLGYVHDTTKIWRIWDPEHRKVVNCSDVEFDENQTTYLSCIDNENDALGLPELEPIYAEEHVDPRLHAAPEVSQPSAVERISEEPRLHAAPRTVQPNAVRTDPVTPDEVVTSVPKRVTRSQRTKELVALVAVPDQVPNLHTPDRRSYREALNSPLYKH